MRYLLLLLLTGCSGLIPLDYTNPPPSDWPRMEERISYVDRAELREKCGPGVGMAQGCSTISFKYTVCWIYLASKDPALLSHEREHCKGYDHVGDHNRSRNAWERWKRANGR